MNEQIENQMRFLRLHSVIERTGLARSTIYELMTHGSFPSQVSLGARAVGWLEADINKWISEKVEASARTKH